MNTLLIIAGGTGGHIMPALAVAHALRDAQWRVVWMGQPQGMEASFIKAHNIEAVWLTFPPLRGKGWRRKLMLPWNLFIALRASLRVLKEVRPHVVLGFGGYISFPGGVAAWMKNLPLIIHEQNAIAGLANRCLSYVARIRLCGFPNALPRSVWVGNPVRVQIAALPPPQERYNQRSGPLRLLVLGGSLGAQALNEVLPIAMSHISPNLRPEIVHQSGANHIKALSAHYAQAEVTARTVAFIEDMPQALAWADIVICRAGAMTIAELAASGVASILVPYPHAVDNHQHANAQFLTRVGAAICLPQSDLDPEHLSALEKLGRPQLLEMAKVARSLGRPDATEMIVGILTNLVNNEVLSS